MKKNIWMFISIILTIALIFNVYYSIFHSHFEKKDDLEIYFFLGGDSENAFTNIVHTGVLAAEKNLNLDVNYIESSWDADTLMKQVWEVLEKRPDIMIIPPYFGNEAEIEEFVEAALASNVLVTFWNSDHRLTRLRNKGDGVGYVGQNTYDSGQLLAQYGVINYDLSPSNSVLILAVPGFELGQEEYIDREKRPLGIYDFCIENNIEVKVVTLEPMTSENLKSRIENIYETHIKDTNISAIFVDEGRTTAYIGELLEKKGHSLDDFIIAGFDLSPGSYDAMKKGYVDYVHDQQPYLQGYFSLQNAYLSRKYGFSGLYIDTGIGIVTSESVKEIEDLIEKRIR